MRFVLPCLFLLLLVGAIGCNFGHGIKPIETGIAGEVVFTGPPPEANVAEIRVVATKRFPPENLTSDLIFSNQLPLRRDRPADQADTVRFEIAANPGLYPATGVLWREAGADWDISNILGLYTDPASFAPRPVEISEAQPVVSDICINADLQLTRRNAFLTGTLSFTGAWPEDTELLALTAFPIVPRPDNPLEFLQVQAIDIAVPVFTEAPFQYRMRVPGGSYKFIAVFWKGKSGGLESIRAVGFFACPDSSMLPAGVKVEENATASGIDMLVDLESLPAGVRYLSDSNGCN